MEVSTIHDRVRRHPRSGPYRTAVVLGSGLAGLGAALAFRDAGWRPLLLEQQERPGGMAQTDDVDGFAFDRTGHFLHFRDPRFARIVHRAGVRLKRIRRRSAIVIDGKLVPYPVQYNLWALGSRPFAESALAEIQTAGRPRGPAGSLEELLRASWGSSLFNVFFGPYNEKLWGRPLSELPADCAGDYAPPVDLGSVSRGVEASVAYEGYNGSFLYPVSGRLGDLVDAVAAAVAGNTRFGCTVTSVNLDARAVLTADGDIIPYDCLVNTAPLLRLLELAGVPADRDLFAATELVNVRVRLRGVQAAPHHWIYVPDPDVPFHRLGFPRNVNLHTCPPGCLSLSVEYTPPRRGRRASADEIAVAAIEFGERHGLVRVDECLGVSECVLAPAYVINRAATRPQLAAIADGLRRDDVFVAGRFGSWEYLSMEGAFLSGERAANLAVATTDVAQRRHTSFGQL